MMAKQWKGLLYVKHGRIGSRSEGPDYYLQTHNAELLLRYQDRKLWEPDYHLEFFCRRMVEVEGKLEGHTLRVASIREILSPQLPRSEGGPRLGEPVQLRLEQRVRLEDAPVELELLDVPEDSRCPIGATCVWEGQAVLTVAVTTEEVDGQKVSLTLRAGHPDLGMAKVGRFELQVVALDPVPKVGAPAPEPNERIATLVVTAPG